MLFERPNLERRILSAFEATPPRIPVLIGGSGSGRTSVLLRIAQQLGDGGSQYIDAERSASTPEGFYSSVIAHTPYVLDYSLPANTDRPARVAFDALLAFFREARTHNGGTSTFLIDELLELRTFQNFPGLRGVLREFLQTLSGSQNRFLLATRFVSRAQRLLSDAPDRFDVIHVPPFSPAEVSVALLAKGIGRDDPERNELARMIYALTDGQPTYVQALAQTLAFMDGASSGDPVSALSAQLAVGAHLYLHCRFCYELRLHRARGYGALKAILQILGDEEPLTLTEISHRLGRTPGSTKDYLSWLEDVDLVSVSQKRYSFGDSVLRLWVRLHCRPEPPDEDDISREAQEYAVSRLPYLEHTPATTETAHSLVSDGSPERERGWSMIEID